MGRLSPVAFDLETSGFEPDAVITVIGLATDVGAWLGLQTGGRPADAEALQAAFATPGSTPVTVAVHDAEADLLAALRGFATQRIDGDRRYLCAFNGETWRGGFDLPFLRTACVRLDVAWPFPDLAYADVRSMVARFNTGDVGDLVGVYDTLIGGDQGDPFDDSAEAVAAFEAGDWSSLLAHNLADVRRTYALATLAGRFVPKSDFRMKNLAPPEA